jgi:hypothetical protein
MALNPQPVHLEPPNPAPMSREQALTAAGSLSGEINRIDRTSVKLTTWRVYESASAQPGKANAMSAGAPDPDRRVWVVAISGDITPQFGKGDSFAWAVIVYDATTGAPITMQAGSRTARPPYFDPIQDLGVCGDPIRTMSFRVSCGV